MKKRVLVMAATLLLTAGYSSQLASAEETKEVKISIGKELPQYTPFLRESYYNNCIIVYGKDDRGGYITAKGIASEALKNRTGSDSARLRYVNTCFKVPSLISPPEKYSGKLSIIILLNAKPATPNLNSCVRLIRFCFLPPASPKLM